MIVGKHTKAACEGADPELFFPVGEQGAANLVQIQLAKAYCDACPLQRACLTEALERGMAFGVWGGTTESERRAIIRRQDVKARERYVDHRDRSELVRELASPV